MSDSPAGNSIRSHSAQQFEDQQSIGALLRTCAPHQRAVLGILGVSDRFGLDPAPLLSSLATELPSLYRYKTEQLVEGLVAGEYADEALKKIHGLLPPPVVLAMELAREQGKSSEFFEAIKDRIPENDAKAKDGHDNEIGSLTGLALKSLLIAYFSFFILLKIVPEFRKMFQEFGVELPTAMKNLLRFWQFVEWFWFLIPLTMMASLPLLFPSLRRYLRRWNPFTWRQTEFFPAAVRRQSLAVAAQSDASPSSIIDRILECLPLKRTFRSLGKVQAQIDEGGDGWESLAAEGIISKREAEALALASDGPTRAWLLNWTATKQQNRLSSRTANCTRAIVTIVNLALVVLVALAAIAIFASLIAIMESIS